jgi:hypothetical protein
VERRQTARLFVCGAAALFWELALIRWQGSCLRIVAYFSNFILLSAFFGLGAGALLGRHRRLRLERFVFPAVGFAVVLAVALGGTIHANPGDGSESIWIGAPKGVALLGSSVGVLSAVPYWALLGFVYLADAAAFAVFGYWLARLFQGLPPLRAYSIEIGGSVAGILLFAAFSALGLSPVAWFVAGFVLLALAQERELVTDLAAIASSLVVLAIAIPFAGGFLWSPYYKIEFSPLQSIAVPERGERIVFTRPVGYTLTVNNDYHQMLLDLREGGPDHPFLRSWRSLYDAPYREASRLPAGPVLVIGAGTGNDVSAALRGTDRQVDAVDIDSVIVGLGRRFHPERPYQSPRVSVTIDDARSFLERTPRRYAIVVFGFLDSHTLLSSFSSLRLDNFVYTREALAAARDRLLPGGEIYLTFSVNAPWIHDRLLKLVNETFSSPTQVGTAGAQAYSDGVIFRNRKGAAAASLAPAAPKGIEVPTDDWPFLYLRERGVPRHYVVFVAIVLSLGLAALLLLPSGERRLRLPYFFMGAAFFLLETSNVVRLSILFGSTWTVNAVVFAGILLLVLLGNWLSTFVRARRPWEAVFGLLSLGVIVAWATPTSRLLAIPGAAPRAAAAVALYLGPVLFASVAFALLIRRESDLYPCYGSNLLGAVVGGTAEYASLLFGFRALLVVTLGLYLLVYLLVRREA